MIAILVAGRERCLISGGNGSAKDSALGNTPRLCAQSCPVQCQRRRQDPLSKEGEVDSIRHRLITSVVGMQMVF